MPASGQSLGQEKHPQTFPRRPKIELRRVLGASWEALGATWGLLGCSWRRFGRLGEVLGASWVELGASWKVFGASWRRFGAILGRLGSLLEGSWEALEASRGYFGSIFEGFSCFLRIYENREKPRKTYGFSLIFEVPGEFWGLENPKKSIKKC